MNRPHALPALAESQRTLRGQELSAAIDAEQAWLEACAAPDARFALLADNGIPWAISDLALHAARRVNVPLPGYFTNAQLVHALDSASIDVLLTDAADRCLAALPGWRQFGSAAASRLTALARTQPLHARVELPAGTTKITFTSGSTGQPKGVCLAADSIEAVAASLAAATAPLQLQRHLALLPLATLLDNIASVYAAPLNGATTVLPRLAETGINYGGVNAAALLACIDRHAPDSLILVPELLRLLVAATRRGWHPPTSLRFIAVGGATVAPDLLVQAEAAGLPVYEGYGLSECASVVALNTPAARRRGSVGRVLPHASVQLDSNGQVQVTGQAMLGYLGEVRSSDAQPHAVRSIATGNLGHFDADGFLYIHGRASNLIITSLGRNISPEWVERELLAEAAIGQAVVFGEGRPSLMAVLVPSAAGVGAADIEAALARANSRLPNYAQVRGWLPATAPFSTADQTLTANGRPRRKELSARYGAALDAAYARARFLTRSTDVLPATTDRRYRSRARLPAERTRDPARIERQRDARAVSRLPRPGLSPCAPYRAALDGRRQSPAR
jgi:long-subunit acyl-CoA synthetase (AMP-forming)